MFPKVNILIIDDEALFVSGVTSLLNEFNIITTATAVDGQRGLAILKKEKFDVVLLDLEMPILNGSKTLDNIKQRFPHVKVIIISSYHEEQLIKDSFNRGAKAYVSKREDIETLVSAIREVNTGITYLDNIPALLKIKTVRDRHYFKLIYTTRELEVIALIILEKTLDEMAAELCLSQSTVEKHLTLIYKKAAVKNRTGFMKYAISVGLHYLGNPMRYNKKPETSNSSKNKR